MHEIVRDRLTSPELTLENLEGLTRERILTPIVGEFYNEFMRNGTNRALIEILSEVPTKYRSPILHTLTTHVTKEKPIFVYGIGNRYFANEDKVRFIAASTDLLWCLSLIVDDIVDEDTQRANRETSWYIYGKEKSYESAEVVFKNLQDLTERALSQRAKDLLIECVDDGVKSLKDPAIKKLDSGIESVLDNVNRRARFHCEYPIRVLFSTEESQEIASLANEGLFCVNRAGQILNDVKDLVPSGIYSRRVFSDISSGTTTVPLIMLYEELTGEEKQLLKDCFNNPPLISEQINWLNRIITQRLPRERIYSLILENYRQFLELMEVVIAPNHFPFCQKWVDYKLNQADRLLPNPI